MAPTKIAASMAVAIIIASRLYDSQVVTPFRIGRHKLLMCQDPNSQKLFVRKDTSESTASNSSVNEDDYFDAIEGLLKEPSKSAFRPYVPPTGYEVGPEIAEIENQLPKDSKQPVETSPEDSEQPDEITEVEMSPEGSKQESTEDTRGDEGGRIQEYLRNDDFAAAAKAVSAELDELMASKKEVLPDIQEDEEEFHEHPVVQWTDDSLRDEPSTCLPTMLTETDKTGLSPIRELMATDSNDYVDSPGMAHSSVQACKPLTWVQFDDAWHDDEHSMISNISHQVYSAAALGGPSLSPKSKDYSTPSRSVADIVSTAIREAKGPDDNSLKMELEPHPYWKSAPFLPETSSLGDDGDVSRTINVADRDGIVGMAYRRLNLTPRVRRDPSTPRSSPLRLHGSLKDRQENENRREQFPSVPRKSVSWIDEI